MGNQRNSRMPLHENEKDNAFRPRRSLYITGRTSTGEETEIAITQGALCSLVLSVMMVITSALSLFAATLDQFESFESCSSEGCKFFAQNGRLVGVLLFTSGIVMILITVAYIYGYTIQSQKEPANTSIARGRMRHSQRNTSTGQIKSLA